jgi:hypothetical protein
MLTVNPLNPWLGQTVTAVAGCIDPEGDLVNCTIDWADGSPVVPGPIASHTYSAYETLGAHNVCAICTDINGNSSACCVTVMVTQPLTRFSVKLAALETKGAINLAKPTEVTQRVNIKVKNESRLYDAVVNVNLYRWRFRTTSAVDHQNSWTLVSVPKGRTISLTPYFYYTYQCDDRPSIKWKAVVILLNGTDSKPQNNAMIKQVNVHGDKKVCP